VSDLPFIDAHEAIVRAGPEAVWDAAAAVVARFGGGLGSPLARALGCSHTEPDFPRAVVGFRISRADRPIIISLRGDHRFSRYMLEFSTQASEDGATILRAESRAEFPGPAGKLYRALVIGTRAHVLAVRRLLDTIKRQAERS
jgi:hypothetical protein